MVGLQPLLDESVELEVKDIAWLEVCVRGACWKHESKHSPAQRHVDVTYKVLIAWQQQGEVVFELPEVEDKRQC